MPEDIWIEGKGITLAGRISIPAPAQSWVIFAHGSGSSRNSARNNWVANELNGRGHATLLFDLLTPEEDLEYKNRFDLRLLAQRLELVTDWLQHSTHYHGQPMAYFGASTGAGAALIAAADRPQGSPIFTVISRGGRPDLAGEEVLRRVTIPVLLIVGGLDEEVIGLNEVAKSMLPEAELEVVQGAGHLFEEAGKLDAVVALTGDWLDKKFKAFLAQGTGKHLLEEDYAAAWNGKFQDRRQAGKKLGERLLERELKHPVILALPRGGVPVADEVARLLGVPLDVIIARKIGAPGYEEYGIGAVSEDEVPRFGTDSSKQFDLSGLEVRATVKNEIEEVRRRIRYYRSGRELPELEGRIVIVIDDGLATGVTAVAAGAYLRTQNPRELIFAAPVCPQRINREVRQQFDEIICLQRPRDFQAVGLWYADFPQIEDEEVLKILDQHHHERNLSPKSEGPLLNRSP